MLIQLIEMVDVKNSDVLFVAVSLSEIDKLSAYTLSGRTDGRP